MYVLSCEKTFDISRAIVQVTLTMLSAAEIIPPSTIVRLTVEQVRFLKKKESWVRSYKFQWNCKLSCKSRVKPWNLLILSRYFTFLFPLSFFYYLLANLHAKRNIRSIIYIVFHLIWVFWFPIIIERAPGMQNLKYCSIEYHLKPNQANVK